jgi:hypothetical protein
MADGNLREASIPLPDGEKRQQIQDRLPEEEGDQAGWRGFAGCR